MSYKNKRAERIAADQKAGCPRPDRAQAEWRFPDPDTQTAVECGSLPFASSLYSVSPGVGERRETFPAGDDDRSVSYIGPWLSTDHGLVVLHLVHQVRGRTQPERVTFYVNQFLARMKWPNNTHRRRMLWQIMSDLRRATMVCLFTEADVIGEVEDGIICRPQRRRDRRIAERDTITFNFSPEGLELFRGIDSYLALDKLCELKSGVETWLYCFIKSVRCREALALDELYALAGARGPVKEFGRHVRSALKRLKALQVIDDYRNEGRGRVRVVKRGRKKPEIAASSVALFELKQILNK